MVIVESLSALVGCGNSAGDLQRLPVNECGQFRGRRKRMRREREYGKGKERSNLDSAELGVGVRGS